MGVLLCLGHGIAQDEKNIGRMLCKRKTFGDFRPIDHCQQRLMQYWPGFNGWISIIGIQVRRGQTFEAMDDK